MTMFKIIILIMYCTLIILNNNLREYLIVRGTFICVPLMIVIEFYFYDLYDK